MIKGLYRLNKFITAAEKWGCVLILSVIVSSILLQVFSRYFLGNPLTWPEELSTFLLVWVTFLGASWVIKQSRHAAVESFVNLLPVRLKLVVGIAVNLIISCFLVLVLVSSFSLFPHLWDVRTVSLRIPRCCFLLAVIVSFSSMLVFFIEDILTKIQSVRNKENTVDRIPSRTEL